MRVVSLAGASPRLVSKRVATSAARSLSTCGGGTTLNAAAEIIVGERRHDPDVVVLPLFILVVARRLSYPAPMNIVSVNDLAASVRQARRKLGWTQAELAERSGVSRDWIIGLERAKPSQEIALVLRTLKALDLNLSVGSHEERTWTQKAQFPSQADSVVNLDDLLKGDGGQGNTP